MAVGLSIANPTPRQLPGPQLLHHLVPREGQNVAVEYSSVDGDSSALGYDELHFRAEGLARRITSAVNRSATNVQRLIVPILVPQCPDLYISQLATLKAGGAFCPIVLDAPEERIKFILQDVDACILLTTSTLKSQLPHLEKIEIIAVDDGGNANDGHVRIDRPTTPKDAAYVMYTSGSTGQPKGVVISHFAATQALLAHDLHIPRFQRFLQFASPTFDVSVFEIFFPWMRGGTLVGCDRRRLLNDLPAAINDLNVDACELTPSVANSLLRGKDSVPSLKVLLTIGEMLKPAVVKEFGGDNYEPAVLHGMYGPTEATIHCTLHMHFPKAMSCGSIGVPLDTVSAFVVKPAEGDQEHASPLQIVTFGEEGELAIGGYQLADGYLNREQQTKAAFVRHPKYGMLYRTGDRARMLPGGRLECLGRISSGQVKLRGQRIELGEIEYAASRTPGCRDVVAEIIQGILVVFCVQDDPSLNEANIRNRCREWLPHFMVPGDILLLESLPYLPSGKCDRRALRDRYEKRQDSYERQEDDQPRHIEEVISSLSAVLGSEVRRNSSLPALGLDSLSAIRVASELKKRGLPQLDAGSILSARTTHDLVAMIHRFNTLSKTPNLQEPSGVSHHSQLDGALASTLPPELLLQLESAFPCTAVQAAMLTETNKSEIAYCNWVELFLPHQANSSPIRSAFQKLSKSHPLLRAGFAAVDGLHFSYTNLVWKHLLEEQIQDTTFFDYDFRIHNDRDLLRPLHIQLVPSPIGTRVLLQIHHALFDQWAIDVLRDDLSALLKGENLPKELSFEAVSKYHSHANEDQDTSASIGFWQDHLRDATPTSLPLLRGQEVPSALQRTRWQDTTIQTSDAKHFARNLGCSTPAIFQAALAVLLGQYSGNPDVIFGSVFSGRTIPVKDIDRIFGPCLATLPVRIDCSTVQTGQDLLVAVTDRTRSMQEHMLISPSSIRQSAGIDASVSLFDALFVWQESTLDLREIERSVRLVDSQDRLEFNLVLELVPTATSIKLRVTYQQRLICSDMASMIVRQFVYIVMAMMRDGDCSIEELSHGMEPDLLSVSNPDPIRYASRFELTTVIESRAARSPSATAICFANCLDGSTPAAQTMSYAELDSRANQLAHVFIGAGLKPESLVCICMEKCTNLYVAMLASFKAGAGYLPLVPETPSARVKSILSQVDIGLCICDANTASSFRELTDSDVLDISHSDFSVASTLPPQVEQIGSRVAYAVFTSGSTGEPKGVAVTMDNLKGNIAVLGELYNVSPDDRLLQSCSQAFDVSVFEIFFAFYSGMCLCSATKDVMFRDFEHSIRAMDVTHLSLTPTVAALVNPAHVPNVRFLVTAGEGITEKVHRTWAGHGLHQGYGPSETTNICSVKMNLSDKDIIGNIGPPFCNTSAFVLALGNRFQILPSGSYGEFAFGGEQVFKGYIGRDDLNASKIIHHPEYGRIYRSGDMGRILPDGKLLISGRLDDQVKIRGNRVELGEINAVVSDHSGVSDCTTIVLGDSSATQMLVTFWVPTANQSNSSVASLDPEGMHLINDIFDRAEDVLPSYMVPSILVPLNHLPMTLQGKLDKRRLQHIFSDFDQSTRNGLSRSQEVSSNDGPSSPTEHAIAESLADVLAIPTDKISRSTSFFALGLNSLNGIQLARAIEKRLHKQVGVATILQHSSIVRLSRTLSNSTGSKKDDRISRVHEVFPKGFCDELRMSFASQGRTVTAILPCTPLQQATLSAGASSGASAYCNTTKLNFSGDLKKLRNCWREMTKRHSILRTSFVETQLSAHPYAQIVLEDPTSTWHSVTNRQFNSHVNGQANGHGIGHMNGGGKARRVLEPVTPTIPIRIDEDGEDIYLQMHHAVYDGVSVSNLFKEIQALYRDEDLPPPLSFEPFLEKVLEQNGQEAIDFWSARIQGFQPHPFPIQDNQTGMDEAVFYQDIDVPPSTLTSFSERHACTSLAVFQAAWIKTLSCLQDMTDICFGNILSGRSVLVEEVERLVAPCFNTVPLRTRLDSIRTNLDLIRDLHRQNVECLPFQLTASRRIQIKSKDPSLPLFDSVLLVQPPQPDSALWDVEDDDMDMGLPIVVEITPRGYRFELHIHHMPEKVPSGIASVVADAFVSAIKSCIQYPLSSVQHFMNFDTGKLSGKLPPAFSPLTPTDIQLHDAPEQQWTAEEDLVRKVFADLSGIESSRISKQTSLYQIGLDSLNAVQIASRLRKADYKVDAADVMQLQTPAALAAAIQSSKVNPTIENTGVDFQAFEGQHRRQILGSVDVDEEQIECLRPCTTVQSGMLAQFIQSQGTYYFNHSIYEIPDEHNENEIRDAWAAVQRKHQILRMGFQQLEDASSPFAILIYKPGAFLDRIFTQQYSNVDAVEEASKNDVLDALHIPAWRVFIFNSRGQKNMLISMHHALYDADALGLILSDFAKALQSLDLGPATDVDSALRLQFEGAVQGKKNREKFWRETLASAHLVKFPSLTPKIVRQFKSYSIELPSTVNGSALEMFCKHENATVQALGQSVWAMLLASYLGESEVTFGTVFAGTANSTTEPVAFPTIATLPIYCDTSKTPGRIVQDMVSYNAALQRHRFSSLSDIQRYAGSAGQPLFDTIFVYQKTADPSRIQFNWRPVSNNLGIDYVVSMEMELATCGKLCLRLTYDTRIVPDQHALLMLQQFDVLLKHLISHEPDGDPVPHELLSIVPAKEQSLPSDVKLLHEFVERAASVYPGRPALEFVHDLTTTEADRPMWTYQQLNERGNQVAHLLQQHDVRPGSIVAVCMTKCPEATFAFIGVLKAGCAFLAMDPDLPLARRIFISEDSESKLVFVNAGASNADLGKAIPNVELSETALLDYPISPLEVPRIDPEATSYCLYTSGTTGTPKGCELTHENAVQAMMAFQRLFAGHWTNSSRWLQFASYWFDVSVLEQFWSWSVGITVVGAPRDVVLEDLPGFIRAANITHIDLTPSLARLLKPEDVPSLHNHVFITGGEALRQEIIDAWGPLHTIYNGYGPTEATIGVTMNPHIGVDDKPSNIGSSFDNVGAYVFKRGTDEPVLRGAVGELCVSGKLVGKGYLNRPELTAKAFPFLKRFGERVYRTGDLVRLLADNTVSFIGRQDTQAKLRGQRLEIDEIDSIIKSASASISDVASLVVKDNEGSREMLVSFIVNSNAQSRELELAQSSQSRELITAADQACRDRLPVYMVPTHIIPVTWIPLTVNNKVDTKSLIALFTSMSNRDLQTLKGNDSERRSMRSSERKVARILARLLSIDVDEINPSSNIFSLGLSSISAINFMTVLKKQGFSTANVVMVMNNPIIERLAQALASDMGQYHEDRSAVMQAKLSISAYAQRYRSLAAQSLSITISEIESVAPCTALQEGLLIESLKGSRKPYFNHFFYCVSNGDNEKLQGAIRRLHSLVPILRTAFLNTDEGFCQVVLRSSNCPLETFSIENEGLEETVHQLKSKWKTNAKEEVLQPLEFKIINSPSATFMAIFAHHAIYDGISWDLMMDRLRHIYEARTIVNSGPHFLDALPYGPLRKLNGAKEFWQDRLNGFSFVPLDFTSGEAVDQSITVHRSLKSTKSIETIRRKLGVSHQALLQAAFAIALHQFAPRTQGYGVVLSGRSIDFDGAEEVIGPLFNTVPQTIDLQPTDNWSEYLHRCNQSNAAILTFQHTPLRDVRKFCGHSPSDPIFDVLFVFQHPESLETAQQQPLFVALETFTPAEYPLAFEAELRPSGEVYLTAAGQGAYVSEGCLERLMDSFEAAIACIVEDAGAHITEKFAISSSSLVNTPRRHAHVTNDPISTCEFEWTLEATKLREIIAQLVGCDMESVNEHVTVFTLGLDSIDAVKLASRMKRAGMSLPVSKILRAETIPKMLEAIEISREDPVQVRPRSKLKALEQQLQSPRIIEDQTSPEQFERVLPATPGQEALIADMIRSNFQDYYNSDILLLRPDSEIEKLKAAWQTVVDSSPILRTSFAEVSAPEIDVTYIQQVHRPQQLHFEEVATSDLESLSDYIAAVKEDVRRSYSHTSPLRLGIATVEGKQYLVLSLAHAQYDGHSLALLHEDVARAYHGSFQPRPLYDETLDLALSAISSESVSFWSNTLTGAKLLRFPAIEQTESVIHHAEETSAVSASSAKSFCQTLGVSLQALVQTAWTLLLAHYLQNLEVIFGVVLACRDSEEAEQVLFPTMNTVPVRASLHGTGQGMVRYMQIAINDMRPFQRTPLRAIQSACANVVQNKTSQNNLFDSLFIYQNRGETTGERHEALYESVGGNASVEYPVAVEVEAIGEEVVMRASCKSYALDERGTNELLQRFDQVLGFLVNTPEKSTVDFSGDGASICGLPSFPLHVDSLSREPTREAETVDESEDEFADDSPIIDAIRSALSQVSKVPNEDICSTTPIESIGIDSISAIKVAALLRKGSIKLPVSEILRAQTPKRMAESLESQEETPATKASTRDTIAGAMKDVDLVQVYERAGVEASEVEDVLPATAGQQYMLAMWKKSGGESFYPTFHYLVRTDRRIDDLRKAWEQVVNHNRILRTVLCTSGNPNLPLLQIILKKSSSSFFVDGTSNETAEQPLVQLHCQQQDDGYELKLRIHHSLYDAVSLPLVMEQLQHFLGDSEPSTPSVAFEDFLTLSLTGQARESRRKCWTDYLRDVDQVHLRQPQPDARKKVQIFKPALLDSATLESQARAAQVTTQALLFAIYAKVYAKHAEASRSDDVVLGIYVANRSHIAELDRLAAPTLNVLPLVVRGAKTNSDVSSVAKKIDADVRTIGSAHNSSASLVEIYEWTGLTVDSFVNFLKLPEKNDDASDDVPGRGGIVTEARDEWTHDIARVVEIAKDPDFAMPAGLEDFHVGEAYPHAVDVELSISNGTLRVGLFGLEDMMGLEESERVVEEMKGELESLAAKK